MTTLSGRVSSSCQAQTQTQTQGSGAGAGVHGCGLPEGTQAGAGLGRNQCRQAADKQASQQHLVYAAAPPPPTTTTTKLAPAPLGASGPTQQPLRTRTRTRSRCPLPSPCPLSTRSRCLTHPQQVLPQKGQLVCVGGPGQIVAQGRGVGRHQPGETSEGMRGGGGKLRRGEGVCVAAPGLGQVAAKVKVQVTLTSTQSGGR